MDIFQIIDSAERRTSNIALDSEKQMITLKSGEYDNVYRELRYKNTLHFADKKGRESFLVRISSAKDIEKVMRGRKVVSVSRGLGGPQLELSIEGLTELYSFGFSLDNELHLYELKRIFQSREVYVYFILWGEKKCIQCFSALLAIDDRILERLVYMVRLTSEGEYPRIDFEGYKYEECSYLKYSENLKLLEEVLRIMDRLQQWGSKESFNVYVDYEDEYTLYFEGDIQNLEYIKKELSRSYEIKGEGMGKAAGKPFFKFDRGMVYFYKTNLTLSEEVLKNM